MNYLRLELHNHTTESDSALSCQELVDYMDADGVDAFALTDHNTISGHGKVQQILADHSHHTQCIYGMEYTTYYGHILCLNLYEYVPWDSIDLNRPELLFQAVKAKGGIAGIAHPFSFGAPFARGCRFEMTVLDYGAVDFIEVFNNPEPLHEVNERGLCWWEELVLQGHKLAATCGMDLHGKQTMAGQYATFLLQDATLPISQALSKAIHTGNTWVSRGLLLEGKTSETGESLTFSLRPTAKTGYSPKENTPLYVVLRTKDKMMQKEILPGTPLIVPFDELKTGEGALIVIPHLYEGTTGIENLICLSPVIHL